MITCSKCGEENPERARFCLNCAASLEQSSGPSGEVRKTVTVVFCDVTGSTALGERLDPEALRRVMSRYFEALKQVLERHGGTVEKFIGDAVMAVFGLPALHEDDALRAVRAAAEMRVALDSLNDELERDSGVRIAVRTGVNTGEVVAGDPSAGQVLVTGDAVNVAARLEQAATPGEILIGEATYRLVRNAVEVESVEALAVKGKARVVGALRLRNVIAGAPAFARRLDSPLVGRAHEIALITQAHERAVRERTCHLFTVLGSAGVGKSRLVGEFVAGIEDKAAVLTGRCLPYGEGTTFWPVAEIVKEAARITESDSSGQAVAKIAALVEGAEDDRLIAALVGQAMGIREAAAPIEEVFWAIRRLFEEVARRPPLVIVFEDLHWGEPMFLDLVEHIADWSRDAPILLVCVARAELLDQRAGWGGGKLNATSIHLEPLTEHECEALIENLLNEAHLAPHAKARIIEACEGNPLFVEELLAMLIDEGLLRRDDGRWASTADLSEISVPPTIHALIAARIDRLGEQERQVAERASVIGKEFWRGAVYELSPETTRAGVGNHLSTLVRKDLIRPHRSSFPGDDAFRFRHMLIRDAAYESMPKHSRAELHERFAGWLEKASEKRSSEYEEILGYHLEQAYRYRAELGPVGAADEELARKAGDRLFSAGRRAMARSDPQAAANLLGRAADLLPPEYPDHVAVLLDLAQALIDSGDLAGASRRLAGALETARGSGDRAAILRVRHAELDHLLQTNPETSMADVRGELEAAIPVLESHADDLGLGRSWLMLGKLESFRGRSAAAETALERASVAARRAGDHRTDYEALAWIPVTLAFGAAPAEEVLRGCDELLMRHHDKRRVRADALVCRGVILGMLGRIEEAHVAVSEGREIQRDTGMRLDWLATSIALALTDWLHDLSRAEPELREAYVGLEQIGETGFLSSVAAYLAEAVRRQGRDDEAEKLTLTSEALAAPDDFSSQAMWRHVRAQVLARRGEPDRAEALARKAVEILEPTDSLPEKGIAHLAFAKVLLIAGRSAEAQSIAGRAAEVFEQKGAVAGVQHARLLLGELVAGEGVPDRPRP